jgi:REP element-mobilizing transposase RayT
MVRWYHLILTAYGFWLPNDPRGSWSEFVASWELYKFGPPTKVSGKRSYAHDPHDVGLRRAAKRAMKYPPVRFDRQQRAAIVSGFAEAVASAGYIVFAGCVGNDHAHLVIGRHDERTVEQIARHLKAKATMHLTGAGLHPLRNYVLPNGATPTPWAEKCWSVFINDDDQLRAAIAYVERHPVKEGLTLEPWSFLAPFDG